MFISDMVLTAPLPDYAAADASNWVACLSGAEPAGCVSWQKCRHGRFPGAIGDIVETSPGRVNRNGHRASTGMTQGAQAGVVT